MDMPLPSQVRKGKCPHKLKLDDWNSTHDKAKGPVKEGTLKSIVSKYERLSSSTLNTDIKEKAAKELTTLGKLKGKGWRAVVGLKRRMRDSFVEHGSNISSEAHPVELMEVSIMSSGVPDIIENKCDNRGSKFPARPVIRGKKEGCKWQSESRLMSDDKELQIPESFETNQSTMIAVEAEFRLKVKSPEQRKESLVQMRIRALEQSERSGKIQNPTIIYNESPVRTKHNDMIVLGLTASNEGHWLSGESKEGDKARLQNSRPLLAPKKLKGLRHEDTATGVSISSAPSPKAVLGNAIENPSTPNLATRQLEITVRSQLDAKETSFQYPLIEEMYDFGTRNKEIPRRTLAPIIQERIRIFERYREEGKTTTASHAPSATFRLRTNKNLKANDTTNPVILEEEDVVEEKHARAEPTNPNTNQPKKVMSMFSKCLAERKMPSPRTHDFKVSGKYVSAFAQRRKIKEMPISTSWASATTTGSEPSSLSERSIICKRSRPMDQSHEISSNLVSQIPSEQQSTSSRLLISWSSQSDSRARTLSDWSHESNGVSPLSRSLPTLLDRITTPYTPTSVSLCAMNSRAALVTVIENGGEQVAASQTATTGRNRWGMVEGGASVKGEASDNEDLENIPLIVKSLAPLNEPKPLRITEVKRMLKMCRLGRSRSGEAKNKGGWD